MAINTERILPVGIQDFRKIRERGFVYVDKTARIYELLTGSGEAFFLSRPRRFGKSLLCSTLGAIFEGRRELFGEIAGRPALAIDTLDWEWKKHPVIHIDLNAGEYSKYGVEGLYDTLRTEMRGEAEKYGVELNREDHVASQFKCLIKGACQNVGEKAVVIIDEYDNPLTSTLLEPTTHVQLRDALKAFYGVLKSYDAHLRFIFLIGISKFSQISVFSSLNQLSDLTLDPRYADICGLTQDEIEANFGPEIDGVLERAGYSREEYLDKLRQFYNGYRFSRKPLTVYNPFGLLNHFENGGYFQPYWYRSGTPTLLTDLINERDIDFLNLNNMQIGYEEFERFEIDNMEIEPLLYQTGYLTITDYDESRRHCFTLDYPNLEVRSAFSTSLAAHCMKTSLRESSALCDKMTTALCNGDVDAAMEAVKLFMTKIPYDLFQKRENFFQSVIYVIFAMLGLDCRTEERIATGRVDMVVETRDFVYCFEFKLDGTAEEALAQIDSKEYAVPWTGRGKKVFKVGVNFDFEKRNIGEWVYGT
ncbi:MAG: ATP-binding protein [Chitinispirillales bacterium]|jgi:hypothetical protein|nr:ATP-binding protein [Chitinispirillales bacterium]